MYCNYYSRSGPSSWAHCSRTRLITYQFRFSNFHHPPNIPERLLNVNRQQPVSNNYVAEFSTTAAQQPPPRPYKPVHLRSKPCPDPRRVASYSAPKSCRATKPSPTILPPTSSRDEKVMPRVHPPTLDDFIRAQRIDKKPTRPIVDQPRPGRHGFICPSCRKCTCTECVSTNLDVESFHCDKVIDVLSCFCLIRACAYHAQYDETLPFRRTLSDKPGSCQVGSKCALRWTILSGASLMLPCLLLYPLYKSAYRPCITKTVKSANKGCSCRQNAISRN